MDPKLLLTPYIKNEGLSYPRFYRKSLLGNHSICVCYRNSNYKWYIHFNKDNKDFDPHFDSKELAFDAIDKILIKRGYTLLTDEQYDKYKLLL